MMRGPGSQQTLKKLRDDIDRMLNKLLPEHLDDFDAKMAEAAQASADGTRPVELFDEMRRMRKKLERYRVQFRQHFKYVRDVATRRTGSTGETTGAVGVASQREFVQVEGERSVVVCNRRREFWEWETK